MSPALQAKLATAHRLHAQRRNSKNKLHALHAPEFERPTSLRQSKLGGAGHPLISLLASKHAKNLIRLDVRQGSRCLRLRITPALRYPSCIVPHQHLPYRPVSTSEFVVRMASTSRICS